VSAKLWGVEQRAPPIFGRAAITSGIGPHSSLLTDSLPPSNREHLNNTNCLQGHRELTKDYHSCSLQNTVLIIFPLILHGITMAQNFATAGYLVNQLLKNFIIAMGSTSKFYTQFFCKIMKSIAKLSAHIYHIDNYRPSLRLHTIFPVFLLTAISDPSRVDKNSTESCGTNAAFHNQHKLTHEARAFGNTTNTVLPMVVHTLL